MLHGAQPIMVQIGCYHIASRYLAFSFPLESVNMEFRHVSGFSEIAAYTLGLVDSLPTY